MVWIIFFLIVLAFVYCFFLLYLGKAIGARIQKNNSISETHSDFKVSVVIPFRDEANHIPAIVQALKNLDFPRNNFEVIFVNDHSEDNGFKKIPVGEGFHCIHLSEQGGKKAAIKSGISMAKFPFILTLDADCSFSNDLLVILAKNVGKDQVAWLLPIFLRAEKNVFLEKFQQFEWLAFQGITMGSSAGNFPLMANGAGFLFRKEAYLAVEGEMKGLERSSGDDIFLLHALTKQFGPGSIQPVIDRKAVIFSHLLPTWKQVLHQRLRWGSKNKDVKSWSYQLIYGLFLIVNVALLLVILSIIFLRTGLYHPMGSLILVFKFVGDYYLIKKTSRFFDEEINTGWFILSFILYPFYLLLLFILSWFYTPSWKGRKIN